MTDQLDAPLKARRGLFKRKSAPGPATGDAAPRAPRFKLRTANWPLARGLALLTVLLIAGIAARVLLVDDPQGGRPSVEVDITSTRNTNEVATSVAAPAAPVPQTSAPETPAAAPGTGPEITTVGDDVPDAALDSPASRRNEFGALPDLVEETKDGPLPRVSAGGLTPFEAYARPSISAAAGKPRIAIILTGLGLSAAGTYSAIEQLPESVTMAFAPYGKGLLASVRAAQADGHEILLEVPLEPFDYPDNDPGPETLLTGQTPRANLDKLYWLMSRFGGYVGLVNNMGARFTSAPADFLPVMEELGTRGLAWLDDGSSNRSVAQQLATQNHVPFARGDAAIDAVPARADILKALQALESRARDKGSAIGMATALPVTISTLAAWSRELEDRGIVLVPVSALMTTAAP